jgi:hypothetical protein
MKRLVFLLLVSCGPLYAQFEGVVESKNTTTDETGLPQEYVMTMWIKDAMARITNSATGSAPATTMIYRTDLKVVWMLNDEDKTYFEVSQKDAADQSAPESPLEEKPSLKKTGKTKKIMGYPSEQILIRQSDAETEIWGTKKLDALAKALAKALGQEQRGQGSEWTDELMRMGVFPLLAYTRVEGKVMESQEIVRIERRPLENDLFAIPAGYRRQSVGEMLK